MTTLFRCFPSVLLAFCLAACDVDQPSSKSGPPETALVAKWQLVASAFDIGNGSRKWNSVENGYQYEFAADGTFSSDRLNGCTGGTYQVDAAGKLTLNFECEGGPKEYVENLSIADSYMYLSPVLPAACIEGCSFRFARR